TWPRRPPSSAHWRRLTRERRARLTMRRRQGNRALPTTTLRARVTHELSFAQIRYADGSEGAPLGRYRQTSLYHEPPQESRAQRMSNGRLPADPHQAIGVVDRLPADARERMNAVAAADVVQRKVGTPVHQQLNHVVATFMGCAHQRGSSVQRVLGI